MKQHIDKNITIEDLTTILPDSVVYLMKEGIRCLRCGEPIWGTLETAAKEKELPSRAEITLIKESVYGDTAVLYYQ